MDKKRRLDRPKLRKEDISTPVNFVHVQHVGFGHTDKHRAISGSFSACTSPTVQNYPFFDPNHRLSDSSLSGQSHKFTSPGSPGKENRYSYANTVKNGPMRPNELPPLPPPHSSMSNLSMSGQRDSMGSMNILSMRQNKPQPLKASFTGSLLNLSFLQFGKSDKFRVNEPPSKPKRMSLSPQVFSTPPPPELPSSPPPTGAKHPLRRRSSSFTGERDFVINSRHSTIELPGSNRKSRLGSMISNGGSALSAWMNNSRISRNPSQLSPPMSPTYEELPPPPSCDLMFSSLPDPALMLPESPTYDELMPPPPSPAVPRRKCSADFKRLSGDGNCDKDVGESGSASLPPPRMSPDAPNPKVVVSGVTEYKIPAWRSKVVRVNAPTLPPLCVPLLRPSDGSLKTPPSWPLDLEFPPESEDVFEEPEINPLPSPPVTNTEEAEHETSLDKNDMPPLPSPPPPSSISILDSDSIPVAEMRSKIKKVEPEHVSPLSRLFQSRTAFKDWPIVMKELVTPIATTSESSSQEPLPILKRDDEEIKRIYGELVTKTLELWLELGAGNGTFEDVISAFERAQNKISEETQEQSTDL